MSFLEMLSLPLVVIVLLGLTWVHDRWQAFLLRTANRSLEENLKALERTNWWQILVCILIGLAFAVMFYLGFIFQLTGGWQ